MAGLGIRLPSPGGRTGGSEDDEPCAVCGDSATYEEEEHWISCDQCAKWFHLECTGLKRLPADAEPFLCMYCTGGRHRLGHY